jgi:hypothetical protein
MPAQLEKIPNDLTKNKNIFTSIIVLIFFCFGFLLILKHELRPDEMYAWLFARDSSSIPNLLFNLRYEPTPPLWYILLYLITRFTSWPVFMQIFHLLIATVSIWIFTKFSPFSKLQKTLFAFGFFPLYQYGIISRNYALGILFIFVFCAIFSLPKRKYTVLFGILFFLAQSNFLGAIMAIAFGFLLLGEILAAKLAAKIEFKSIKKFDISIGILLFSCLILLLFHQLRLPPDTFYSWTPSYFTKLNFSRIADTLGIIHNTYFLSCTSNIEAWPPGAMIFLLSLAELFFIFFLFLRKRQILFLYFLGTFALLTFYYIKQENGIWLRHKGHLYILLIACLWIADYFQPLEVKSKLLNKISITAEKYRNIFILVILSLHFFWGIYWSGKDYKYSFSAAKDTAQFIKNNHLETMPMLGNEDSYISPITGYLNNKIYYVQGSRLGSYVLWNRKRQTGQINLALLLQEARRLRSENKTSILIILNYSLETDKIPTELKFIEKFTNSKFKEEKYYLYLLSDEKNSK